MFSPRSVHGNEKGIVLPVALMLLTLLTAMGGAAVVLTRTDFKIAGNYKSSAVAFHLAEAGVEYARHGLATGMDLDSNSVVDENQVFDNDMKVKWDSTAVLAALQAGSSGKVTLVRDKADPSLAEITSKAKYGAATQTVKLVVKRNPASFITIPGAVVQVSHGWNDFDVGGTVSGIDESKTCPDQAGHFHRGSLVIIEGSTVTGNPDARSYDPAIDAPIWDDPDKLVAMIEGWMNDPNAVTITGDTPPKKLGTEKKPQTTVWDPGSFTSSNQSAEFEGYGILIIKGRFNLKTQFEFHGLIVAHGEREMSIEGGNGQVLHGAILAAANGEPPGSENTEVGVLNNTEVYYNCDAIAKYVGPLAGGDGSISFVSWRQVW